MKKRKKKLAIVLLFFSKYTLEPFVNDDFCKFLFRSTETGVRFQPSKPWI